MTVAVSVWQELAQEAKKQLPKPVVYEKGTDLAEAVLAPITKEIVVPDGCAVNTVALNPVGAVEALIARLTAATNQVAIDLTAELGRECLALSHIGEAAQPVSTSDLGLTAVGERLPTIHYAERLDIRRGVLLKLNADWQKGIANELEKTLEKLRLAVEAQESTSGGDHDVSSVCIGDTIVFLTDLLDSHLGGGYNLVGQRQQFERWVAKATEHEEEEGERPHEVGKQRRALASEQMHRISMLHSLTTSTTLKAANQDTQPIDVQQLIQVGSLVEAVDRARQELSGLRMRLRAVDAATRTITQHLDEAHQLLCNSR